MNQIGFPILSVIIFLPLAGAIVLLLFRRTNHALIRGWSLAVALADLVLTLILLATYRSGEAGMQFVDRASWIPSLGIHYHLGLDGFSLFLLPLTALLFVIAILASWKPVGFTDASKAAVQSYFFWILMLETAVLGVFAALDLILFYVFWEAMLVPMYFLIGRWGGARRAYATTKFFIYTMAGSALMLVAILALGYFGLAQTGTLTFDWVELRGLALRWPVPLWLFGMFALAFAVKVPIFPFHTWLPDAYGESPIPVTLLLAGILSKMGLYGFLRFCVPLFPQAVKAAAPLMAILALIGIVYASLSALAQRDLKQVIAYSSIAHLSLIVLGIFVVNEQTLGGAVIQMVSHGIYVTALFLIVGMLAERTGTRRISEMGGLWVPAPVLGVFFLIALLGAIGLPGLNGFVGEFTILVGVFQSHPWWAGVAALTMVLGAWYMLSAFQRVMQGKPTTPRNEGIADVNGRELLIMVPLIVLIFLIGILPNLILEPVSGSVSALAAQTASVWLALVH